MNDGRCGICGKAARYVSTSTRGLWVHVDTGNHIGLEPTRHDVNTHVVKSKD